MMRTAGSIAGIVLLVALGFFIGTRFSQPPAAEPIVVTRSQPGGPTIEQIQKLSELTVLHVPISDVQISELAGFTGGVKLVLAVHGDVNIATDLNRAKFEDVNQEARTALLVLPQPQPSRPRLNHEKTRILELQRNGAWRFIGNSDSERILTNQAMVAAQQMLGALAAKPELLSQACQHTETVIRGFFAAMGWDVQLQWQQQPEASKQ